MKCQTMSKIHAFKNTAKSKVRQSKWKAFYMK